MSLEKIHAKKTELLKKIQEHQLAIEHIQLDLKQLYLECGHPNMKSYVDIAGVGESYCADCGYKK